MYSLRKARREDIPAVCEVLQDACDRLQELGVKQWPKTIPLSFVEKAVDRDEFWIVSIDGRVSAVYRLLWSDKATWGPDDGLNGYVHTLAVHRYSSGTGFGRRLLTLIEKQVLSSGRKRLRLDCVAHNQTLRQYYMRAGFQSIGERRVGLAVLALFEKKLPIKGLEPTDDSEWIK
jgi:ribosomal protein S18 acetylase RimI-like enzyme